MPKIKLLILNRSYELDETEFDENGPKRVYLPDLQKVVAATMSDSIPQRVLRFEELTDVTEQIQPIVQTLTADAIARITMSVLAMPLEEVSEPEATYVFHKDPAFCPHCGQPLSAWGAGHIVLVHKKNRWPKDVCTQCSITLMETGEYENYGGML